MTPDQPCPYPVGTRVKLIGGGRSGHTGTVKSVRRVNDGDCAWLCGVACDGFADDGYDPPDYFSKYDYNLEHEADPDLLVDINL